MSDRPDYPSQIGDALARALDPEADAAKRAIWQRVAGVLDGVFAPKPIDILVDPTVTEVYMPDGKWCWAKIMAWQLDPSTGFPVALWLKVSDASKDWEKIWPATSAEDHKFSIDAEDEADGGSDYAETKIIQGTGTSISKVTGAHGKALQIACTVVPTPLSDEDPLPDAAEADPGVGTSASRWDHVHPLAHPEKIRYYLSDTHGTGDWTGHLLLTENPYAEESAIDYENASEWAVFVSDLGSPGISIWQGGVVHAHLRVKLINPQVGRTYRLYTGNGDIVYTSMIWDWESGDVYQDKPSAPSEPTITTDYQTLDFDIPVTALAAGTDGRLGLNMRLRVFVGSEESTFSGEQIVIRIGGDNASYLDTLFTPDGGFSGEHNDLDGRSDANCHPMSAITPGRILTPSNATVTPVDGLFAVPSNSNYVEVNGTDEVIGISTAGWTGTNSKIDVFFMYQRVLKRAQTVPDGYAPLAWGTSEAGYGGDIDTLTVYADCVVSFRLIGGNWRIVSMLNL